MAVFSLQNSGTTGQIYKIRTAFDRSGKFVGKKRNIADLGVTDDVTGQVNAKMFDDSAYLVLSRTTAVSNGNKRIKRHGSCLGHF